jgi:Cytochrome P460
MLMLRIGILLGISLTVLVWGSQTPKTNPSTDARPNAPKYTPDGRLMFPENYREWMYLSTGIDMNYRPSAGMDHSMFDNVFVNPESYKSFVATGTWPDKTMLVLEVRGAASKSAINKAGHYQTTEIMGTEVHVKDEARFSDSGKWAFFAFDTQEPAQKLMKEMACYSCHEQHAAVETTFVQFYPTLLEIAKKKGTRSSAYLKEEPDDVK